MEFATQASTSHRPLWIPRSPIQSTHQARTNPATRRPCLNSMSSMSDTAFRVRRGMRAFSRRMRELKMIAGGAVSTNHPIMAHIIPIRRCNLSCTYCNEYDDYSKPVPTDTMVARLNHLADLGTRIITFSGGEPLLHPDLDTLISTVRSRGSIAGMITNGYNLMPDRIQ